MDNKIQKEEVESLHILKEKDIIDKFKKMGIESLPPKEFEQLQNIIKIIYSNRKKIDFHLLLYLPNK